MTDPEDLKRASLKRAAQSVQTCLMQLQDAFSHFPTQESLNLVQAAHALNNAIKVAISK